MFTEIVYVKLLNEGTDVWRPVKAINIDKNVYEISLDNNYNEDLEEWEFLPGTKVLCDDICKDGRWVKIAQSVSQLEN